MEKGFFNKENVQEMKVDFLSLTTPGELERIRRVAKEVWPQTYKVHLVKAPLIANVF